ncbi:hypothetical protein G5V57_24185 [Nordella sp. HKS 07]|uniref:hypothetical protein n=1 Tax=Nordella sp. HKS 07 TaxID=2712222 RepID=UPI0013E20288|nr:hypothetical protein [Nordella sp. HKS 07]QIG50554.1 hypothetical protein G5V57_24185 [Nordella sp. HKS 07]
MIDLAGRRFGPASRGGRTKSCDFLARDLNLVNRPMVRGAGASVASPVPPVPAAAEGFKRTTGLWHRSVFASTTVRPAPISPRRWAKALGGPDITDEINIARLRSDLKTAEIERAARRLR